MFVYEVKFISYNKQKTNRTAIMKALVIAPSPTLAKNKIIKEVKEVKEIENWEVDIKSIKNLGYKIITFTK